MRRTLLPLFALLAACGGQPGFESFESKGARETGGTGAGDEGSSSGANSSGAGAGGASSGGSSGTGPTHTTSASSGAGGASSASSGGNTTATTSGSSGAGGNQFPCSGGSPPADTTCYWEEVCPDASLADLSQGYSSGGWQAVALEMMNRRYPSGACILAMYPNDIGNYADTSSFGALADSMMTMVHEETHGYDYEHASWGSTFAYYVGCNQSMTTPWLDGFPRSEILPYVQGSGTNLYNGTYLTGTQGTYGFVELLDEWNAYINGMAAIGLVGDYVPWGVSGTDGAVAFAYYVELYLYVARTKHPTTYSAIAGDPAFVNLLRQQWNRMHFFLELSDAYPALSIHASEIKQNLYAPQNLSELEMVVGSTLTASACN